MGGTRPADRPASAGRWGRQASTDHSQEDGEGAVDAVLFTVQDPRTARHRRVPTAHDQRQRQKTAKHESERTISNPRLSSENVNAPTAAEPSLPPGVGDAGRDGAPPRSVGTGAGRCLAGTDASTGHRGRWTGWSGPQSPAANDRR